MHIVCSHCGHRNDFYAEERSSDLFNVKSMYDSIKYPQIFKCSSCDKTLNTISKKFRNRTKMRSKEGMKNDRGIWIGRYSRVSSLR